MTELPDWYMAPMMIGGHATGPLVLARADNVVVALRQVLAYPTGVEIEVEAHAHGPSADGSSPVQLPRDAGEAIGPQLPRFRVRLADGTEAAQDDEAGLRSGRGPMLVARNASHSFGDPRGREDAVLTLWLWPLPSSGPVTLTCSWPRHGVAAANIVLDGDAIRAAARQAVPFWSDQP